jgi:IclR family pca regulon transcriptional regulator
MLAEAITTNDEEADTRSRYHVEAIKRGLSLMVVFDSEHPSLTLSEIARRANVVPSTALRLLSTLLDLNFLEEVPRTERYTPSIAALRLGHASLVNNPLRSIARPSLSRLLKATGESVSLSALVGSHMYYIDHVEEPGGPSVRTPIGSRLPIYCTAAGKSILACLPAEEREKRLRRIPLNRLGPNTQISLPALLAELEVTQARGYATQDEEISAGLRSVGAAVRAPDGTPDAAVTVVVSATRMSMEKLKNDIAPIAAGAAAEITARRHALADKKGSE